MNKKVFALSTVGFLVLMLAVGFGSYKQASADNGSDQSNGSGDQGIGQSVSAVATTLGEGQSSTDQANANSQDNAQNESENGTQESVKIDANGNFTITGATVVSVDAAGNSITGTLYGITKTLSTAGATITGGSSNIALSSIQPGDILSATGNYSAATHTATLLTVNDVSYARQNTANIQSRINQLLQLVQQLQAQLQTMQQKS